MTSRYQSTGSPQHGWDHLGWHDGPTCIVTVHHLCNEIWIWCGPCQVLVPLANAGIRIDADLAFEPRGIAA